MNEGLDRPAAVPVAYRAGLLCLAATAIGWGLNWPAMRVLLRQLPPMFARGSATIVASLVFVVVALILRQSLLVPRSDRPRLVLAAMLNVFAWMGFGTIAMQWLDVARCALIVYTMPVWAVLLAWPLAGQRPTARALAGLVLCAAGLWTLFGSAVGTSAALGPEQWLGVAFALAAAIAFACGTVAVAPFPAVAPIPLLAWQLGIAAVPMLVIGLAFETPDVRAVTPLGWALMLYMTLVPMGVCYLTWFAALRRLPSATASIATLATPAIGVVSAAITLGEPLGLREVASLGLTLSGVALALRAR